MSPSIITGQRIDEILYPSIPRVQALLKSRRAGELVRDRQRFRDIITGQARINDIQKTLGPSVDRSDPLSLWFGVDFGRGPAYTVNAVHMSEVASWPDISSYGGISRGPQPEYSFAAPEIPGFVVEAADAMDRHMEYLSGMMAYGVMPSRRPVAERTAASVCVLTEEEEKAEKPSLDLPRVTVGNAQAGVDEMRVDLAYRAEKLLGYPHLRKHLKLPTLLGRVLAEAEIEPLDPGAVQAYKKQAVLYRRKELKRQFMARPDFASITAAEVLREMPLWQKIELDVYELGIPDFALDMACRVAEGLKDAQQGVNFYVEELLDDPFLVVECEGERAYLAVWLEPGFEEQLRKQREAADQV